MKKLILAAGLLGASTLSMAVAPGGNGCGWGNMILEGQSGAPVHFLATSINGTSYNATFGMTSGTNGCSTSGKLTYGGTSMLGMIGVMDEVAENMAVGQGEALTALAVSMGIEQTDRATFSKVMHENFSTIFSREDMTAHEVVSAINETMKTDARLVKYAV